MELNIDEHPEFDRRKHAGYVVLGYCPSVHSSKAYCCQPVGHAGEHVALYLKPDQSFVVGTRWG